MSFTFGPGITIETGITIESGPLPPQPPTLTSVTPALGLAAGNTLVSLVGNNFVGATSVTFGGNAALSYTIANTTSMTARTPAGTAGSSVSVQITNPAGVNAPNTAFGYYPLAPNTAPALGTQVAAPAEAWANFGSAQSGVVTSTQPQIQPVYNDVNPTIITGYPTSWQLCYTWQSLIIQLFANYTGYNVWAAWSTGGTNMGWAYNDSNLTPPNTANFPTRTGGPGSSGGNYAAGAFATMNLSGQVAQIAAGQYFLLGVSGPFATFQTMSQNKTFTKNGSPWWTATNTCYYPSVSTNAEIQVTPGQLGGASPNYTTLSNTTIVMSIKPF
jgi:hypothetical protein